MEHKPEEKSLHLAVEKGNIEAIKKALRNGDDINARDCYGNTPLHHALKRKDNQVDEICTLLLERGANVQLLNRLGESPLLLAVLNNHQVCVSLIIDSAPGKDTVNIPNNQGYFPIHYAVGKMNVNILNLLLDNSASAICKVKGRTPFHIVAFRFSVDCASALLERGATINDRDDRGWSPLHLAVIYTDIQAAGFLLQIGADVNLQDNDGKTPLHLVPSPGIESSRGDVVVNMLLDWEASLSIKDHTGKTPLDDCPMVVECAKKHIVRRGCVNLSGPTNVDVLETLNLESYQGYRSSCLEEVNRLQLAGFDTHSLYDVFRQYSDPRFLSNDKLNDEVNLLNLNERFPIYSSLIKSTHKRAKARVDLLRAADHNIISRLPGEITWYILTFLDDNDLENVIQVKEPIIFQ